ncbi:MAG: hypothetical protein HY482_00145 [Candidatus Wildermuthbacteria bacterium]|nr:hypothetical protein [Candidatus Wildermuthbacteria bacterium]
MKYIGIIGVIGVLFILGFVILKNNPPADIEEELPVAEVAEEEGQEEGAVLESPRTHTVVFTDEGYNPKQLAITQGDTVVFKNEGSMPTWPATAMHPTHTIYPGSDIEKCGTQDEAGLFDACRGIEPGKEWSFRFQEKGAWGFHDHLNVAHTGKITVE